MELSPKEKVEYAVGYLSSSKDAHLKDGALTWNDHSRLMSFDDAILDFETSKERYDNLTFRLYNHRTGRIYRLEEGWIHPQETQVRDKLWEMKKWMWHDERELDRADKLFIRRREYPHWPRYADFDPKTKVWNTRIEQSVIITDATTKLVHGEEEIYYYWEAEPDENGFILRDVDLQSTLIEQEPKDQTKKTFFARMIDCILNRLRTEKV